MNDKPSNGRLGRFLSGFDAKTITMLVTGVVAAVGVGGVGQVNSRLLNDKIEAVDERLFALEQRHGIVTDSLRVAVYTLRSEGKRTLYGLRRHSHGRWAPAAASLDSLAKERREARAAREKQVQRKKGWWPFGR